MMEWITVLALIIFGLCLVVVEIIFVPGTTLVGVMGFLFLVAGVYLGFEYFDNTTAATDRTAEPIKIPQAVVLSKYSNPR